jgi:hypothetical protein
VERYALRSADRARWHQVRSNHQARARLLPALSLGSGWTPDAGPGGRNDNFGIVATADVELPAGRYRLSATSDDGVCVFVDDKPVVEAWVQRRAATDSAVIDLTPGRHAWRVEYFNVGGPFGLSLEISPIADAAAGQVRE